MYRPSIKPNFKAQRTAFLATQETPDVELPASLEKILSEMAGGSDIRSAKQLWRKLFRVLRMLLLKATLISLCAAGFASLSTLVAMRILRSEDAIQGMVLLALTYFLMNCLAQFAAFRSNRLRAWVSLSTESYLAGLLSRKILALSALSAARQSPGNLKVLITSDIRTIGEFFDNFVRNFIPALAALVVISPLIAHFTGESGVIGILIMALILPLALGLNQVSAKLQEKTQTELDRLTSLIGEWVKNVRLIRFLSWDEQFRVDLGQRLRGFLSLSGAVHFMACLTFGLSISWWMVSASGVVLGSKLIHHELDLVGFFGSLWLLTFMAGYFTHVPNTLRLYALAAPSV